MTHGPVTLARPDPSARLDAALVDGIVTMVNDVYRVAEAGLWVDGVQRTTPDEVAHLLEHEELVLAHERDVLVGCAHVHEVDGGAACSIGMLVAAPDRRGLGLGRELLAFGEQHCRDHGLGYAQLELLVPQGWVHPEKARLAEWYDRQGFVVARVGALFETHPHLEPLLATPCALEIRRKTLG